MNGKSGAAKRQRIESSALPMLVPQSAFYRGPYVRRSASEKKWFETVLSSNPATTGTIVSTSLNLLTAGTGESQIIGRKVVLKSVQINGSATMASGTSATLGNIICDDYMDLYVILDMQCNGAAATIANVFEQGPAGALSIDDFKNLENSQRFRVLKHSRVAVSNRDVQWDGTNYFVGQSVVPMENIYLKCNIPLEFGATPAGVITDLRSNNVFVAAFSKQANIAFAGKARVRFSDA